MASVSSRPFALFSLGLLTAASSLISGCKQEDPTVPASSYADASAAVYCEAVYSCQCDDYPYESANVCYDDLFSAYTQAAGQAMLAGLGYDGSCPQDELQTIRDLACKGYVAPPPDGVCFPPCNAFYGPQLAGLPCDFVATSDLGIGFSNCAQGLSCISGVCADPCQAVQNLPSIGEPCPDLLCATGAMCDPEAGLCVAQQTLPGPGQPCVNGACNPNTSVCVVAANTCAALPTIGQSCVEGMCDPNGYCDVVDDVCLPKPPIACYLLGGAVPGDGDGDPTGDGDGDPTGDGDGDGDPTGDGDGDPGSCGAKILPTDSPVYDAGTTVAGAGQTGSCGGSGSYEIPLSFTAPIDAMYLISTEGSSFDTVLYVRDGGCDGPELACNDDDGIDSTSLLGIPLAAGQEVTIYVDSFDDFSNDYVLGILF